MILVTGSAGYIGSHLCFFLRENNIKFIAIDNLLVDIIFYSVTKTQVRFFQLVIKNASISSKIVDLMIANVHQHFINF